MVGMYYPGMQEVYHGGYTLPYYTPGYTLLGTPSIHPSELLSARQRTVVSSVRQRGSGLSPVINNGYEAQRGLPFS